MSNTGTVAIMMPMSTALEKTGVSQIVSENLVSSLGAIGPYALLAGIYFTTSLMTMFISNTATAVLMAPKAFSAAQQIGVSPYSFMFAVTLGASMCFASPFSTPPNALVMKAGRYTFMDYVYVGLPLQIILGIVMTFVLPLLFPLLRGIAFFIIVLSLLAIFIGYMFIIASYFIKALFLFRYSFVLISP